MLAIDMPCVVVLTVELDDPGGYGRIVRDTNGEVVRIVEEKDARPEERRIREVNTGIMVLPTARLSGWLSRLSNDNAQEEYYLTDIVALAIGDGVAVKGIGARAVWETLGVNSRPQLALLERRYQEQYANRLLEQGVTLMDPSRFDVRGDLVCKVAVHAPCADQSRDPAGQEPEAAHESASRMLKNRSMTPVTRRQASSSFRSSRRPAGVSE